MAFHDIILEDLARTPDYRARRTVPIEVTSVLQRWPSVLFETIHKRQADMEYLRRACMPFNFVFSMTPFTTPICNVISSISTDGANSICYDYR